MGGISAWPLARRAKLTSQRTSRRNIFPARDLARCRVRSGLHRPGRHIPRRRRDVWHAFMGSGSSTGRRMGTQGSRHSIRMIRRHRPCLAYTGMMNGIREENWISVALALAINPNSSRSHTVARALLVYGGEPAQGRAAALTALRLSPRDPINLAPLAIICLCTILSVTTSARWKLPDVRWHVFQTSQSRTNTSRHHLANSDG